MPSPLYLGVIMLVVKNAAGYKFVWPDNSDLVEVFHDNAPFPEYPLEVLSIGKEPRGESTLKRIACSTSEYARYE